MYNDTLLMEKLIGDRRQTPLVDRRRVTGSPAAGHFEVESLDPLVTGTVTLPALKDVDVTIGDDVVVLYVGGGYVIIGALQGVAGTDGD